MQITKKQIVIDFQMEKLANILKIDNSHEKTDIIDDDPNITNQEWGAYYIYLCILDKYLKDMDTLKSFA
jgi:hypothetical protein